MTIRALHTSKTPIHPHCPECKGCTDWTANGWICSRCGHDLGAMRYEHRTKMFEPVAVGS